MFIKYLISIKPLPAFCEAAGIFFHCKSEYGMENHSGGQLAVFIKIANCKPFDPAI